MYGANLEQKYALVLKKIIKYDGCCHRLEMVFYLQFWYMCYNGKVNSIFGSWHTIKTHSFEILNYICKVEFIVFIIEDEKFNLKPFIFI